SQSATDQTPTEARRQRGTNRAKDRRAKRGGGQRKRDLVSILPWILAGGVIIVVLIVVVVLTSGGASAESAIYPDHWHAAYSINLCGTNIPPLPDSFNSSKLHVHTHSDGLIHLEPGPGDSASDSNMKTFFKSLDTINTHISTGVINVAGEQPYKDGD